MTPRHDPVAVTLHWLMALALVGMLAVGLTMTSLPLSPLRLKLTNWHKWAGMVILALATLRLLWRIGHRPPAPPPMPAWQHLAARGVHGAMYLLFFAVPLAGWLYSSAAGFPVVLFGVLPLPDLVAADRDWAEAIKPLHRMLAYALAALIVVHVAAALQHHFIERDGLLWRIWPWGGAR